tara:strand:+ start:5589 stop:5963 length:375 start_codon:yes stop_codon:yes gene_type:complete
MIENTITKLTEALEANSALLAELNNTLKQNVTLPTAAEEKPEKAAPKKEVKKPVEVEVEATDEVTGDTVRNFIKTHRVQLKKDGGDVAAHRTAFKDLLNEGDYKNISAIPAEALADFLADVKAL